MGTKNFYFIVVTALTVPNLALAQSADCKQEVDAAVKECGTFIQNAKSSDVSQFGAYNGGSTTNMGVGQAGAANAVASRLAVASDDCQKSDLNKCLKACNSAMQKAQANGASVATIRTNMQHCSDSIQQLQASSQSAQNAMSQVAGGSMGTATSGASADAQQALNSNSSTYNDTPVNPTGQLDQEGKDGVQLAGSGPMPIQFIDKNGNMQTYMSSVSGFTANQSYINANWGKVVPGH